MGETQRCSSRTESMRDVIGSVYFVSFQGKHVGRLFSFLSVTFLSPCTRSPLQFIRNHRILLDKEAQTALICLFFVFFYTLGLRLRLWACRPCDQSLGNVIMNTVSLLSKQWTGWAVTGANCLHRCVCVSVGLLSVGGHICEYMHGSYFFACTSVF